MDIRRANEAYESWLRTQLRDDVIEADLAEKKKKMSEGAFPFLRATYWRWAETILAICPGLEKAPHVLAVGDIHLENFGTWRDADGRLVWGVNDFDEAAEMPYALDLVRLAASAVRARPAPEATTKDICEAIAEGYGNGLTKPRPFVLDEDHLWLRELVAVPEKERAHFWTKMDELKPPEKHPSESYRTILQAAMPDHNVQMAIFPRTAGTGSLGRPRWVGIACWRGGRVLREAKALVPSGWTRVPGRGSQALRCGEIAGGRYRAPDAWYEVKNSIMVRRLSPNSRKIEVKDAPSDLLDPRMLHAMGHDLASVHLGTGDRAEAVAKDLAQRKSGWLHDAVKAAVEFVTSEYEQWKKG